MERVFDLHDIPDPMKVKLVVIKLKKSVSLWWEYVQQQRYQEGKNKVDTWEKMKRLMKDKFLPANHKQDAYLDYHNLRQQSLTMEEFIGEFERMRLRYDTE